MFIYGFECDIVYMLCFFNRLVGSFISLHICVFHRLYVKDGNTHHDSFFSPMCKKRNKKSKSENYITKQHIIHDEKCDGRCR